MTPLCRCVDSCRFGIRRKLSVVHWVTVDFGSEENEECYEGEEDSCTIHKTFGKSRYVLNQAQVAVHGFSGLEQTGLVSFCCCLL